MNEQLIKFIELCLVGGVISDKEREVIFRKSKELGVPEDECEIILKGMIQQKESSSEIKEEGQNNSTPKSLKSNFQEFIDKHKNDKNTFGKNLIVLKTEIKNQYSGWLSPKELNDRIDEKYDEIVFGFKNSIIVLKDGSIISNYTNGSIGKIFSYEQVLKFTLQEKGFVGKGNILFDGLKIGNVIGNDSKFGYQIFKDFQNFLKENPPTLTPVDDEELGDTNLEESIPVIKEEISTDLIRIITTSPVDFWCFEFRKDSIKVYKLGKFFGEVGIPVFFRNEEVLLNLEDSFQIQDSSIYEITSLGKPDETSFLQNVFDINIYNDSYGDGNRKTEFIDLRKQIVHDSRIFTRHFNYFTNPDELNKLEKILYFFQNITSYENMISLEKSYSEHQNVLSKNKELLLKELDKDGNGVIDISENNDFSKLLKSKQKLIIEFEKSEGKNYIQNFIKLSKYLKDKSGNIQSLFEIIREDSNISNDKYDEYVGVLRNQINTYNLMLLSSLNMIITLTEDDRITFYEIYETFDKLNVFSSNHEIEMSMRLKNIESKLDEVVQSIYQMEMNICSELYNLQFITEDMSDSLSGLSQGLSEINSSIQTNNLLTGIQTYQMYKINQNTKGLRG